jgi:peptidoglycan/LPS O-acetylase OafA/YrhL
VKLREIQRLRGVAILMVLMHHAPFKEAILPSWLRETWSGVDLFFVISGFVVTRTLLPELPDTPGQPFVASLGARRGVLQAFYARRLYRLLPMVLFTIGSRR